MTPSLQFSRRFYKVVHRKVKMPPCESKNFSVNRPLRVSIEGNIASGKSTLVQYFQRFPYIETHGEPLDKWRNVEGHNLLSFLYEDLTRWNATFQSYVQLTRTEIQTKSPKEGTRVQMFERSVQNNRYCFMKNAFKSGFLSPPEYSVLCKWYEWIQENVDISLDLIVYLKSSPEVVYERVKSRNRNEEKGMSLDYLQKLHEAHENWLTDPNLTIPVFVVDANSSLQEITKSYQKILTVLFQEEHLAEVIEA